MRITIEHEGRVADYNFQDGTVVEVKAQYDDIKETHDFMFIIKDARLWTKMERDLTTAPDITSGHRRCLK